MYGIARHSGDYFRGITGGSDPVRSMDHLVSFQVAVHRAGADSVSPYRNLLRRAVRDGHTDRARLDTHLGRGASVSHRRDTIPLPAHDAAVET